MQTPGEALGMSPSVTGDLGGKKKQQKGKTCCGQFSGEKEGVRQDREVRPWQSRPAAFLSAVEVSERMCLEGGS